MKITAKQEDGSTQDYIDMLKETIASLEAELKKKDDIIGKIETFIASRGHDTWWDYNIFKMKQEPGQERPDNLVVSKDDAAGVKGISHPSGPETPAPDAWYCPVCEYWDICDHVVCRKAKKETPAPDKCPNAGGPGYGILLCRDKLCKDCSGRIRETPAPEYTAVHNCDVSKKAPSKEGEK